MQSMRLARHLRGFSQLRPLHALPKPLGPLCEHSRLPRTTSYCVEATMRRLCSSQPADVEKPKPGKKSKAKSKKTSPSSEATPEEDEPPGKKKPRKAKGEGKRKTQAELMADHVAQEPAAVQQLLQQYEVQLNRRKHDPEAFYIINESIADSVAAHLPGHSLAIPHLELSPGPGVLTRRLLAAGVRRVTGFETVSPFQHCARVLSEETGGAVSLTPLNLLNLSKFCGAAAHGDESRVQKVLAALTRRPWSDDPCLRIVGVAHRSVFFQFLVRSVIGRDHLFQFGRPELLVFVPETEYQRLTSGPTAAGRTYRPYSILSQMLFSLEPLHRVPATHFYPWMTSRKRLEFTESEMVLIRYTPRADPGVPEAELHNLDFFVRHCAVSKNRRIIQQMEEWVPGCGPRLIALGHGVFSPFRELSPERLLRLFLEFTSWPEYPACSFHAAVQQNALGGESELHDETDPLPGEELADETDPLPGEEPADETDQLPEEGLHGETEHFESEPFR